ncbi:FAD:protein FMN transferase [Novosphingobium sp.]|uniref:FAD:protein FMN transferase n=1 Tax=Novosphingobium sp. TaxID=1874826 RepID=UPI0026029001|nr:FAD:protein FMN transferase [Novosphingobium sp.]
MTQPLPSFVHRFSAMGTRIELHLFGDGAKAALANALQAVIDAVDDALTIHRPSPTTQLNERLRGGGVAVIDEPILRNALQASIAGHRETGGLFDPAFGPQAAGLAHVSLGDAGGQIVADRAIAFDFGGVGKGFALDCCRPVLAGAGVESAILSLGDSSILLWGGHPLGGDWPIAIPDPCGAEGSLAELALRDCCLSVSSSQGAGQTATLRPDTGIAVSEPRTAIVAHPSGARAEIFSTALLAAHSDERGCLVAAIKGEGGMAIIVDHVAPANSPPQRDLAEAIP